MIRVGLTGDWVFLCLQTLLLQRKMGAEKGRRARKIQFSKDTHTEFEFGDTADDIQRRGEERGQREREE